MNPYFSATILNGEYQSGIMTLPSDTYLNSLYVPSEIVGSSLLFFGDFGDGTMRQLNFTFDLTSTDPYYKGQVVGDLQGKFAGLRSLQFSTTSSDLQTEDIVILGGYAF